MTLGRDHILFLDPCLTDGTLDTIRQTGFGTSRIIALDNLFRVTLSGDDILLFDPYVTDTALNTISQTGFGTSGIFALDCLFLMTLGRDHFFFLDPCLTDGTLNTVGQTGFGTSCGMSLNGGFLVSLRNTGLLSADAAGHRLGAGSGIPLMTQSSLAGSAADRADLGLGAGGFGHGMAQCLHFGIHLAVAAAAGMGGVAVLGAGGRCNFDGFFIVMHMIQSGNRLSLGGLTDGAGEKLFAFLVFLSRNRNRTFVPFVTVGAAFSNTASGTGLWIGAGGIFPVVSQCIGIVAHIAVAAGADEGGVAAGNTVRLRYRFLIFVDMGGFRGFFRFCGLGFLGFGYAGFCRLRHFAVALCQYQCCYNQQNHKQTNADDTYQIDFLFHHTPSFYCRLSLS